MLDFCYPSLIYKDMATHDKLIFPSAITKIIRHASISYLESPHFSVMSAINGAFVRQSEAQLPLNRPQTETVIPPTRSTSSTSTPSSSSTGGVTFEAVMAQLQHINAHLDTLSDELCQVNTHVSHIA